MAVVMSAPRPCTRVQGMRVAAPVRAVRAQAFAAAKTTKVSFRSTSAVDRSVSCEAKKSVGDLAKADLEVRSPHNPDAGRRRFRTACLPEGGVVVTVSMLTVPLPS